MSAAPMREPDFENGPPSIRVTIAAFAGIEGGRFSNWGSRLGAADIRLNSLQNLHVCRADRFQNGALALAPRTFAHLRIYSFSKI